MQQNPQNSSMTTFIITAVILVGSAGYYFYSSGGAPSAGSDLTLTSFEASTSAVGQNVLTLLNEIHSLNIDSKFFKTSAYESLTDFSVPIPSVNVGRANPFSPIVGSASTTTIVIPAISTTTIITHSTSHHP